MMSRYFARQAVILMLPFMLLGYLAGIVVVGLMAGYNSLNDQMETWYDNLEKRT